MRKLFAWFADDDIKQTKEILNPYFQKRLVVPQSLKWLTQPKFSILEMSYWSLFLDKTQKPSIVVPIWLMREVDKRAFSVV